MGFVILWGLLLHLSIPLVHVHSLLSLPLFFLNSDRIMPQKGILIFIFLLAIDEGVSMHLHLIEFRYVKNDSTFLCIRYDALVY